MKFDKPNDPHSRDTSLARLLAAALESRSAPSGGAKVSDCPDAELLAAYADHGLAKEESAHWESHFADCGRCQKIIAVLTASSEELTEADIKNLGTVVAASAAREPVSRQAVVRPSRPTLWRWLAPAVGVAIAVAMWFALHPASPREGPGSARIAAKNETPQVGAQGVAAASSANPGETQVAQANLPPPPAAPPARAGLRDKETAQAKSPAVTRGADRKQEPLHAETQTPALSESDHAAPRPEVAAKDKQALSGQAAEQKSQTVTVLGEAPPVAPAAAPPVPGPPREAERAQSQRLDGVAGSLSRNEVTALAKKATPSIVFGSPDRRALWRAGSGGSIERSADQGQTWQPQSSGVTADLLAGAAPSGTIAWAVGRAGIIVRTEDGEHWQRVAPPPFAQSVAGPAPDWIGIEARDARHATIIARDLRRFVTEDGGGAWVQER